jgi:sulfatase maturation enzyme AslB (radical SAM superfamily)
MKSKEIMEVSHDFCGMVEFSDGGSTALTKYSLFIGYVEKGVYHRTDGPAVIWFGGELLYYFRGNKFESLEKLQDHAKKEYAYYANLIGKITRMNKRNAAKLKKA